LMTLPVGRRALLAAAQNVEPDASWD
jgi:hypothetical protein